MVFFLTMLTMLTMGRLCLHAFPFSSHLPTQSVLMRQRPLHPHFLDMWPRRRLRRPVRWARLLRLVNFIRQTFDVRRDFFFYFFMCFHCVTQHWCCLSAAYPTCFPLTQFTCNNGRCINVNWRCDNGSWLLRSSTRSLLLMIAQISPCPSLLLFLSTVHVVCVFFPLTSWLLLLCVVSFVLCCWFCSVLCRLPIPLSLVDSVLQKRIVVTALMSWIVPTWPVSA